MNLKHFSTGIISIGAILHEKEMEEINRKSHISALLTPASRVPKPQTHENGKAPGWGSETWKTFLWSMHERWWMIDIYFKPLYSRTVDHRFSSCPWLKPKTVLPQRLANPCPPCQPFAINLPLTQWHLGCWRVSLTVQPTQSQLFCMCVLCQSFLHFCDSS